MLLCLSVCHFIPLSFFCNDPPTPEIYPLSLHDALPIFFIDLRRHHLEGQLQALQQLAPVGRSRAEDRSEEHTSELQSPMYLVCRLLLEKKKKETRNIKKNITKRDKQKGRTIE